MFGIRKAHRLAQAAAVIEVPVGTAASSEGALADLDPIAAAAFGISVDGGTVTRKRAMRVPAIRRGRNLIAGTIGTLPLIGQRQDTLAAVAVSSSTAKLLRQLDPATTPAHTITWTVDDLIFHGVSWWVVTDRDKASDYPVAVRRVPRDRVTVDVPNGKVYVDNKPMADRDVIRFDGIDEGLLTDDGAGDIIRLALALTTGAKRQADDDWSGLILRLAEGATELSTLPSSAGDGTTRSEVDLLLDTWEAARRARSTAFMNRAINAEKISVGAAERQLAELWQIVSSELARLLNLPASRIGAPQGSGMTYSNTESDRRDLVDTTLAPFLAAIAQRLSMPDVTPASTVIRFDLTGYLRGTTKELVDAGAIAIENKIASPAEVRTEWLRLPPNTDVTDAPTDTPSEDA